MDGRLSRARPWHLDIFLYKADFILLHTIALVLAVGLELILSSQATAMALEEQKEKV